MTEELKITPKPMTCMDWEAKRAEIENAIENEELTKKIWDDCESMAYIYIYHVLLSF
jgi:hypothetical protein